MAHALSPSSFNDASHGMASSCSTQRTAAAIWIFWHCAINVRAMVLPRRLSGEWNFHRDYCTWSHWTRVVVCTVGRRSMHTVQSRSLKSGRYNEPAIQRVYSAGNERRCLDIREFDETNSIGASTLLSWNASRHQPAAIHRSIHCTHDIIFRRRKHCAAFVGADIDYRREITRDYSSSASPMNFSRTSRRINL
jgi:hypothetical protein